MRTDELRTKRDTLSVFLRCGSARVLISLLAVGAVVRVVVAGPSLADVAAVAVTLLALGPVEWLIHLVLLHAPPDAWTSRRLGTGAGHRQHHLDPPALEFVVLRGQDAAIFAAAFGLITLAWTSVVSVSLGSGVVGPFVTGWLLAIAALAHYEWVHLLIHTKYRPTSRWYRRLERNHRLHHFRNERYWLGVTTNAGDRLFQTYPSEMSAVALSETARTLGD